MTVLRVFVDTGAWFALQAVDDEHHRDAVKVLRTLVGRPDTLVTTNHVIGETYTLLRTVRGHRSATAFLDALQVTSRLARVFVSEEMEKRAFQLLSRYREHDFSFIDATSFAVMRAERIRHAFAFDSHFATAGFLRIPDDLPIEQLAQ